MGEAFTVRRWETLSLWKLIGGERGQVLGRGDAVQWELFACKGRGGDQEIAEEGVRAVGPALQFGMELAADHERVVGQLGDLYQAAIGGGAGEDHPRVAECLSERVIELVAMPMALEDDRFVISRACQRARFKL